MHRFLAVILALYFAPIVAKAQTKPAPTSPAPCVEDMPGMQMCPKAEAPAPGSQSMAGMQRMQMEPGMKELMDNMRPQTFLQ